MKYFKRFTDVLTGIALLNTVIHLVSKFTTFLPNNDEITLVEKLKKFLDHKTAGEYRSYFILALLLLLSIVAGRIFERFPSITFMASLPAFVHTLILFGRSRLSVRPTFYIMLTTLAVIGCIAHALILDKHDGKRRAYRVSNLCGLSGVLLAVALYRSKPIYEGMPIEELSKLPRVQVELARTFINEDEGIIYKIAFLLLVSVVASIILRDIYFIDAALALPSFAYAVFVVATEELNTFIALSAALPILYFVTKLLLVFLEPTLDRYLPHLPFKKKRES